MTWLAFALLAPVVWGLSNVIDEHLVNERVRDPRAIVIVTGLFAVFPVGFALLTGRFRWPGLPTAMLALAGGALGLLVYLPYLRALQRASASTVLLLWNLTPVLILLMARMSIQERLTANEHLAVALLVGSSSLAVVRLRGQRWCTAALPWMIVASVLLAAASVMEKVVYERLGFGTGIGWLSLGTLLATLALAAVSLPSTQRLASALRGPLGPLLLANEGLDLAGTLAVGFATSLGPVTLVRSVGAIQPLLVLGFERVARRHAILAARPSASWLRTAVATALAIVGLSLLQGGV
jgi:uncharacterized membrane protein